MSRNASALVTTLLIVGGTTASAQKMPTVREIDGDVVHRSVAKDAIRSIDAPRFVSAAEAKFMRPEEAVLGVAVNGEARAYSIWHLDRHEIVNDTVGDSAIAVTW